MTTLSIVRDRPLSDREKRWQACKMPHEEMAAEYERVLTEQIAHFRPFIRHVARVLACWEGEYDRDLARDLDQMGMILLWELGVDRVIESSETYIRGAIVNRLKMVRRTEMRASGGERRLSLDESPPKRRRRRRPSLPSVVRLAPRRAA